MNFIDYGLSIFRKSVFYSYPENEPFDLADVMKALVASGEMAGYEMCRRFYEIGSPCGLKDTEEYLRARRAL